MAKNKFYPVAEFMEYYDPEPDHARQVARLALMLFDGLSELLDMTNHDRQVLHAAALLHDVGWSISGKKHHKHSLQLIMQSDLKGWTSEERHLIANIARYHRKALPKLTHPPFYALSGKNRIRVQKLAGIVRIADGLDRSHEQVVQEITFEMADRQIGLILACTSETIDAERFGLSKKKDLFEMITGYKISIHDTCILG